MGRCATSFLICAVVLIRDIQMCPLDQARTLTLTKLAKQIPQVRSNVYAYSPSLTMVSEADTKPKPSQTSPTSQPPTPRSPAGRGPRTPRRIGAQATRLEAVDDSLGPLGPLGDNSFTPELEQPPLPPSKEQSLPVRNVRQAQPPSQSPLSRSMMDSVDLGDSDHSAASKTRYSQGQPSPGGAEPTRRQTQPSVSIEQAARPSFDITVGDPHKVGDLTSSHIVYQVRTKVGGYGSDLIV